MSHPMTRRCVVSTDDDRIAVLAESLGLRVHHRPPELAGDDVSTEAVLLDILKLPWASCEALILLQVTSPLRRLSHVEEGLGIFREQRPASVMSVRSALPDEKFCRYKIEDGLLCPRNMTSDQPLFAPNGTLYIVDTPRFLQEGSMFLPPCMPLIMTIGESLDIDTAEDLMVAEQRMRDAQNC